MIKNHLKITCRTLWKNRSYSFINIIGLALGMSATILIGLWISLEVNFDRFYTASNRLYQVYTLDEFDGEKHTWGGTAAVLGPILQQENPEMEEVIRTGSASSLLRAGSQSFKASGVVSDPSFFKLFDFSFINGNTKSPISEPNSIVLTEALAIKLFGTTNVIGKIVHVDKGIAMEVRAIIENIPSNSTFHGEEFFCSWDYLEKSGWIENDSWTNYNHQTYVLLKEGVSMETANHSIENLVRKHTNNNVKASIYLYPASRWHLYNQSVNGKMVAGNITTIRMFALVGFFILLIACINFINLTTASAERRAKEVGIRKVVGAPRKTLIQQFLIESFILTLLAGALALVLSLLVLPFFNSMIGSDVRIDGQSSTFWVLFVVVIIFSTLGAGIYPAFVLSAFEPMRTLKGRFISIGRGFKPRKILVTFQFTISVCLGICTIIIGQQIRYGQNRETGYDKSNLVYIPLDGNLKKNYEVVRNELIEAGVANSVTKSLGRITHYANNSWGYSWPNSKPNDFDAVFNGMSSDADFAKTMGIKLLAGRDIDIYKHRADSNAVLLNEAAVKRMGLSNPIGTQITSLKGTEYQETWNVVGVIQDFVLQSPYEIIEPMIVKGPASWFSYVHIRVNSANNLLSNIEQIQSILKKYNPGYPIDLRFADEAYASKFIQQKRTQVMTAIASGMAIFIACLGLFGLVSFATMQRIKEIGIRKVLGASVTRIVAMLSADFLKLVLLSTVIASPIAWFIMQKWLEGFVYRIDVHWWIFVIAGVIAMIIALFTVSALAIRAARANPIGSLRSE